ncbi:hypothetical protein [Paenibacillus sp. USHLN196]|uniref:hypothetical protein n=1 Tax=Paenibacillus sp. USHLN196 TaxID=3081291 RepID=UPI00301A74D7
MTALTKAQSTFVQRMNEVEKNHKESVYYRLIPKTRKIHALVASKSEGETLDVLREIGSHKVCMDLLEKGILKKGDIPYTLVSNL